MYSLNEKVVIVTGGACGIGAAIVRDFLIEGAYVTFLDINEKAGHKLMEELTSHKDRLQFVKCDVSEEEDLLNVFQNVQDSFGKLDVVINNAGIADESFSMYKKQIALNFTTVITSTLKALEIMRTDRGGKGGTIINVSSVIGLMQVSPGPFVYGAIKSALVHFGSTIGMESYYSQTKVRILTVCFGLTYTNIIQNTKSFDQKINDDAEKIMQQVMEQSPGQSAEIAAKGVVESFKNAKSGSTWLVNNGVISNISQDITKGYQIMSKQVFVQN
ncbi:unnamed protein product [Leptosia nina]|uniref:Uncharacterized protein n=1 Tax=Leptosia nina TaxID=320188 RepID=A0AAV1IW31_9NEOP